MAVKTGFRFVLLITVILFTADIHAQANQWTWMHGDNFANGTGNYGTQGIPAPSNVPPPRYESAQWTDLNGNLWLCGGGLGMQRYSDLWKFDPVTNQWTWMHGSNLQNQPAVFGTQGIPAPANTPGGIGFGAATWVDLNGNLWLYGGDDAGGAPWADLWKYDIATNMWTWVKGPGIAGAIPVYGTIGLAAMTNTPGAREETACTWTDLSGNLWLFGGTLMGVGSNCNDLWKYDIATNMWTWMKGSNLQNQPGVYGTIGVPAPANTPGARWCYTSWTDLAGNLWLFGGTEALSPMQMGFFNDLWKYDIASGNWTWMSGSTQLNQAGVYGTKCIPAASNIPGGRGETRSCWKDGCGNFWLLGGRDLSYNLFNDLWKYNINSGLWTWVSGDNTPNQPGVYGTLLVPSPANKPGGREGAVSWTNNNGLWLFGGGVLAGQNNDLWLFVPDTISASFTANPPAGCAPLNVSFTNTTQQGCASVKNYLWTFGDPASGNADTAITTNANHNYLLPGTYTVTLTAYDCLGNPDIVTAVINVAPGINTADSATDSDCQSPSGIATVFASGGTGTYTYQWQPSGGNAATATNLLPGSYTVTVTDGNGCATTDTVLIGLTGQLQLNIGNDTIVCGNGSVSLTADINSANYLWSTGDTGISISVSQAGIYSLIVSNGLCSASDTVSVDFVANPEPQAVTALCDQSEVTLAVNADSGSVFLWSTGETTEAITVNMPGNYWVNITQANCSFTDTLHVPEVSGSSVLWFPNSFTPNGDGRNESFSAEGEGVLEFHLMIFNRWGELIFETDDFNMRWDGKVKNDLVQEDVYVWVADYRLACDETKLFHRVGHVSVIR